MTSPTVTLISGDKMPVIGLGTWKSKPGEVSSAVKHAINFGYRHIDCAAAYFNETEVGEGIKDALKENPSLKREELFIVSKLPVTDSDPKHVEASCRETLKDLNLEYLDLYLIHWPISWKHHDVRSPEMMGKNEDGSTPLDYDQHPTRTWLAMEELVKKGLVRNIGVSNFNSEQIKDILENGKIVPATNQVESHPYLNQTKLKEFCAKHGIPLTAYSPLGSPDKPFKTASEPQPLLEDCNVLDIAKRNNKTPAQILLRWQVQRGMIVIPKSVTPKRIEENLDVLDFQLSNDDMNLLNSMDLWYTERLGRYINEIVRERRGPDGRTHPHFPFDIEF